MSIETKRSKRHNRKRAVRVINADGSIGWTSARAAREFEQRGIARSNGVAIEIIATDYRAVSIAKNRSGYTSGVGLASLQAVKGLPVAGPVIRLFTGKRPSTPPREDIVSIISITPIPETFLSQRVTA